MSLISVAKQYQKVIKTAVNQAYANILKVHKLAQTLNMDPYGDKDPKEAAEHKEIAHLATVLADRAFKTGVAADQLRSLVEQMKSKVYTAMLAATGEVKQELTNLMTALNAQMLVDVPAQKAKPAAPAAKDMGAGNAFKGSPDLSPEQKGVVDSLLREQHPTQEEYYGMPEEFTKP